jgi:hypothetical protein
MNKQKYTGLLKVKTCPLCGFEKLVSEFDVYFSKPRKKYRLQNYCKLCQPAEKTKRSADYYLRHKEERLQYTKAYRADPKNKDKRKKLETHFKKKYRAELQDCYVADQLARKWKVSAKDIRAVPGLIDAYRMKVKLHREIQKRTR